MSLLKGTPAVGPFLVIFEANKGSLFVAGPWRLVMSSKFIWPQVITLVENRRSETKRSKSRTVSPSLNSPYPEGLGAVSGDVL